MGSPNTTMLSAQQDEPRRGIRACPDNAVLAEVPAEIGRIIKSDSQREIALFGRPLASRVSAG